ncbi:MAG: hypothetical protein HQM02_10020 [Magnetococcales bacterium]|nr:hypothetical protein [Magnetococcales bacterium]
MIIQELSPLTLLNVSLLPHGFNQLHRRQRSIRLPHALRVLAYQPNQKIQNPETLLLKPATQELLLAEEGFLPMTAIHGQSEPGLNLLAGIARKQIQDPATTRIGQLKALNHRDSRFLFHLSGRL